MTDYVIEAGWLCTAEDTDCGGCSGILSPAHLPGCGLEPIASIEQILEALRYSIQIDRDRQAPATCQVRREGVLLFDGQDRSALLKAQEAAPEPAEPHSRLYRAVRTLYADMLREKQARLEAGDDKAVTKAITWQAAASMVLRVLDEYPDRWSITSADVARIFDVPEDMLEARPQYDGEHIDDTRAVHESLSVADELPAAREAYERAQSIYLTPPHDDLGLHKKTVWSPQAIHEMHIANGEPLDPHCPVCGAVPNDIPTEDLGGLG